MLFYPDFKVSDGVLIKYTGASAYVTIPRAVKEIGPDAFHLNRNIREVTISDGVQKIGSWTFGGCVNLAKINIPESVTEIGIASFVNCESLASVTLPRNLKSIGKSAFAGCKNLCAINIPDGVRSIGTDAFDTCESLTNIEIPGSVTEIGTGVFSGCEKLTRVVLPLSVKTLDDMFCACGSLTSFQIPEGVTDIKNAFHLCRNLRSVTIPNSLTAIQTNAFRDCTSLTEITLPASVRSIEHGAFWSSGITNIEIPNGVCTIGNAAFLMCKNLAKVSIPSTVKSIGDSAFCGCADGLTITFRGTRQQWEAVQKGENWGGYGKAKIIFESEKATLFTDFKRALPKEKMRDLLTLAEAIASLGGEKLWRISFNNFRGSISATVVLPYIRGFSDACQNLRHGLCGTSEIRKFYTMVLGSNMNKWPSLTAFHEVDSFLKVARGDKVDGVCVTLIAGGEIECDIAQFASEQEAECEFCAMYSDAKRYAAEHSYRFLGTEGYGHFQIRTD